MKQLHVNDRNLFFRRDLTLRAKIFNVLATSGVLLCAATSVIAVLQGLYVSMAVSAITGAISAALLVYSARGGNQKFCYIATVVCVFLILFPSLFFTGGGYSGAMGICFVLAVV